MSTFTDPDFESETQKLEAEMALLRSAMSGYTDDVATLKTQMATVQSGISTLDTQMATAQSNVSTLQTQMSTAQSGISSLDTQVTTLSTTAQELSAVVGLLYKRAPQYVVVPAISANTIINLLALKSDINTDLFAIIRVILVDAINNLAVNTVRFAAQWDGSALSHGVFASDNTGIGIQYGNSSDSAGIQLTYTPAQNGGLVIASLYTLADSDADIKNIAYSVTTGALTFDSLATPQQHYDAYEAVQALRLIQS
jgi:prefoldin subunit 5